MDEEQLAALPEVGVEDMFIACGIARPAHTRAHAAAAARSAIGRLLRRIWGYIWGPE